MKEQKLVDINKSLGRNELVYDLITVEDELPFGNTIWTEKHIEELCDKYIVIPKEVEVDRIIQNGYWKCEYNSRLGETTVTCSVCGDSREINGCYVSTQGEPIYWEDDYCPSCGSKMYSLQELQKLTKVGDK